MSQTGSAELAEGRPVVQADERPGVCMFVYNNCLSDQRVLKEARSVALAGFRVTIVAVLDKRSQPVEEHPEFTIIRINRDPLHYKLLRRGRQARRRLRVRRARARLALRRRTSGLRRFFHVRRRALRRRTAVARRATRQATMPLRGALGWRRGARAGLRRKQAGEVAGAAAPGGRSVVLAVVGGPVVLYRAVRWRALRRVPALRRRVYARRATGGPLSLRAARRRVERRLKLDPEGVRPRVRRALLPDLEPLRGRLSLWRPLRAIDKRASAAAYRFLMIFHRPLLFTDYYRRAFRTVRDGGYVVFQAHDVITLPVAAWAARKTGARLVYDSHELYSEVSTLSPRERRVWEVIERRLIRRADRVITVCESIADELVARYSVAKPLILLNCPPRTAIPINLVDRGRLRARARLEPGIPIVLYQGGYTPHRGIEELIDAASYLERGILVLMGWGIIEDALRARVEKAGLSDRVRMIAPARPDELLEFTVGADIGVIPYKAVGLNNYYTTPNKLFEYIAVGLPVAGSRFPELQRVIDGNQLGVTFDPEDPAEIGRALNYLLEDADRLEVMRANAREAGQRYAWEVEAAKLLDVYSELTAIGAGAALPARRR